MRFKYTLTYTVSWVRISFEMHTALGIPVVPDEVRIATVCEGPSFSGVGLT